MNYNSLKIHAACLLAAACLASCDKDNKNEGQGDAPLHKIAVATAVKSGGKDTYYLGTFADFSVGSHTNAKSRQMVTAPLVRIYEGDLYAAEGSEGDNLLKYVRSPDGTLQEAGKLTLPASSMPYWTAFQSAEKGYLTLRTAGKIVIFNPKTMEKTGEIDLTSYAIGKASPDPTVIRYRDNKLYVSCLQTEDGYTSAHPAQILIIDLADNNKITSLTDARATTASDMHDWDSMFFDEKGDLYVFCIGSWGFMPGQKGGFLRVKKGATAFDKDYFLNITDYTIAGIPGGKLSHLYRPTYGGNGIVYATGNVAALIGNPPNYVEDYSFGAFKVDLYGKTVTKLDIPYSLGYGGATRPYQGKVYFGMSTKSGVGIFSYDPATNTASAAPVVTTQGDPSVLEMFD